MSIQKYDAFISYRHAPLDSKIAETIHRQLESFKIPKEIRNQITKKKITRIFRDKEELPVTSDINDNIKQALDNSEHLIVICSHSLKDSIWVKREIEYFLESHSIEQVLTVLAEGEPCEVIPEILQYEKTETDTNTGESKKVLCEPLSCDYRLPKKQAKAGELPRLAAAILGCSYDDLKQRQKQRRRKITTAVLSALFLFLLSMTVFFADTANRIQESYNNALINQSEYLISESQKAYESGDKITATLLALEALPSEDNERPLLSQAVYNLESIIQPYKNENSTGFEPTAILRHEGYIDYYSDFKAFSQDGKYLAIRSGDSTITIWDTESNEKYFEKNFSEYIYSFCFSKNDTLIIHSLSSLFSLDYHSDKELWSLSENLYSFEKEIVCSLNNVMAMNYASFIRLVDLNRGEIITDVTLPENASISYLAFSPDGKNLAFINNATDICIYNLKTERLKTLNNRFERIDNLVFGSETEILIANLSEKCSYSGKINQGIYTYECYVDFIGIDIEKDTVIHKNRLEFSDIFKKTHIKQTECTYDGETLELYICAAGNTCILINKETGKKIETFHTIDSIVNIMTIEKEFTSENPLYVHLILKEGYMVQHYLGDDESLTVSFFNNNPAAVFSANKGIYVMTEYTDTDITVYEHTDSLSSDWIKFTGDTSHAYGSDFYDTENFLIFFNSSDDVFTVISKNEKKVIFKGGLSKEYKQNYAKLLGFTPDGNFAYILSERDEDFSSEIIVELDLTTGKCKTVKDFGDYSIYEIALLNDGYCYYSSRLNVTNYEEDSNGIKMEYDTINELIYEAKSTGEIKKLEFSISKEEIVCNICPTANPNTIIIQIMGENNNGYYYKYQLINTKTGKIYAPQEIFSHNAAKKFAENKSGTLIAITDKSTVHIFNDKLVKQCEIKCENMNINSLYLTDQDLLVGYEDNSIYRYSVKDGIFLNKIQLTSRITNDTVWDFSQNGLLAVFTSDTLNIIDTESWTLRSLVPRCCGYILNEKTVCTLILNNETKEYELGYFKMLDTESLISKAKEKYPGVTLSEQQKTRYGID